MTEKTKNTRLQKKSDKKMTDFYGVNFQQKSLDSMITTMLRGFFSMRLSDKTINRLMQQGKATGKMINDCTYSRLFVRIGVNRVSWYFIGTVSGIRIRQAIGRYPSAGIDQARAIAHKILSGESISTICAIVPPTTIPVFGEVWRDYQQHRKLKPTTTRDYEYLLNRCNYINKRIDVSADDFLKDYQRIHAKTPTQARYLARIIKALQRFAIQFYELPDLKDATSKIRTVTGTSITKSNAKDRRLEADQLPLFHRVLSSRQGIAADTVYFALLTGLRANELRQITAQSISIKGNNMPILTIKDTKNGTDHSLPLVGIAAAILQRRINSTADKNAPLFQTTTNKWTFDKLKKEGISLSWHDLRRSWASFAINAGISEAIIKRVLNHSTAGNVTTRHYAKIDLETIAQALLKVEAVIFNK